MNHHKMIVAYALFAVTAVVCADNNLRGTDNEMTESRQTTTIEQHKQVNRSSRAPLYNLPRLSEEVKEYGFATFGAAFIYATKKGAELCVYNQLKDEATVTKFTKEADLVASITPQRSIDENEYDVDALGLSPIYAATKYMSTARASGVKKEMKFAGARRSTSMFGDTIARTIGVARSNAEYDKETFGGVYQANIPTTIYADSAEHLDDVLQQLKVELFNQAINVQSKEQDLKPLLIIAVANDPLLDTISPQTWADLKAHFNVTTPLDSAVRKYFVTARSDINDALGALGKDAANVSETVSEAIYGDIEKFLDGFNWKKTVKSISKWTFDNKKALVIGAIIATYTLFNKPINKTLFGEDFDKWINDAVSRRLNSAQKLMPWHDYKNTSGAPEAAAKTANTKKK